MEAQDQVRPPGLQGPSTACRNLSESRSQLAGGQAETITQKAVDLALGGDSTALRLCLERLAPARKDAPVSFELGAVTVDPMAGDCVTVTSPTDEQLSLTVAIEV